MSLAKWFASIRERHSSQQFSYERGALISRRLQELLAVPTTTQVDTPSINARSENDPTSHCNGRLHSLWSQQGSHVGYPASHRREV
jgi:hypothetical protein